MGLRVKDGGGSESRPVMGRIGVAPPIRAASPHAKAGRLPAGRSSRESLTNHPKGERQMTAGYGLAGAPSSGIIHVVAPGVYREVVADS
jgi:hypothetical protein